MHAQDLHSEDWGPSPLEQVPHPPGRLGLLGSFDVFHCWHLGVGKNFLSSFIAILSELQPESSVDDRFESLSKLFWILAWHTRSSRMSQRSRRS